MACYDFDYVIRSLSQAIDFAEIEHDFIPHRKWANEVEHFDNENRERSDPFKTISQRFIYKTAMGWSEFKFSRR
jgi:hypothetical protein